MPKALEYRPNFTSRVKHISQVMSQTDLAELVGVSRSAISRWSSGDDTPADPNAAVLLDVDYILGQYAQVYPAAGFSDWLRASNAFLNGASPRDVLLVEGAARVIEALHAEAAGSFA